MYLCDIHSHSKISPDCDIPLADMARAAISAGLREYCVTDHHDLLDYDGFPAPPFDWPAAKAQYRSVKAELGDKLTLRLGLELGSAPYDPQAAREALAQGGEELDYVLASLHNWIGFHNNDLLDMTSYRGDEPLARRAMESTLDHTWTLVTRLADCYDSLAHISYPLRYIRKDGIDLSMADYEERVRAIFTEIARTDHALEVNVWAGRDLDSWPPLLRWFKECGGELVTVGADAHRPQDVARGIPQALDMIKAAGFGCVATFQRRRPILHRL